MTSEKRWVKVQVIADYHHGMSLWKLAQKYRGMATQVEIRQWLGNKVRPKSGEMEHIDESEVAQRKLEVQSHWTPEQASKRWVGRLIQPKVSIHSSASKLLPD
jgi:hypothetical protein